jgi:hypothetical protein
VADFIDSGHQSTGPADALIFPKDVDNRRCCGSKFRAALQEWSDPAAIPAVIEAWKQSVSRLRQGAACGGEETQLIATHLCQRKT